MTKEETLRLFALHDDPVNWEYPPSYDHKREISRFGEFLKELEQRLGATLAYESESRIQDASFHSQILLDGGTLRFSNFGDMVALSIDHEVDRQTVQVIERLCKEMNYFLIDTKLAELPYTGVNPGVTGIGSWWIRYFDWV